MNTLDLLAEYFVSSPRRSAELSGRTGLQGQVDSILNELRIPAELDGDGDWRIVTDVGPFLLVIDKVKGDLVAIQTIQNMERDLDSYAQDMYVLLQLNLEAEGARFAGLNDGDTDLLILTSRLTPDAVSRDSLEAMLRDCMRLSRTIDELLEDGSATAENGGGSEHGVKELDARIAAAEGVQPAAHPAADWYPDPKGEARLRYWDGSKWTEHTAA